MALEIKGLKADALAATGHIDRIRKAYAKFNQVAPAHATDVEALGAQIIGAAADVTFAATVLGNSAGRSDEPHTDTQIVKPGEIGKVEDVIGSPGVEPEQPFPVQHDEPK